MKYDMRDLTVLIPVRIESMIRLENILAVTKYLTDNFDLEISVLEAAKHNNTVLKRLLPSHVRHTFIRDSDPVFYRTKYINMLTQTVRTPFLAVWDADVVFPPEQVNEAVEALRSGDYDIVFPYGGIFWDTSRNIRQMFIETGDIAMLVELRGLMTSLYGAGMKGGAFLANTGKYVKAGMENLKFYGWGPEDWERYERWKNLRYRMKTIEGDIFHLSHPRDMNGTHNSEQQRIVSFYEKDVTALSSIEEMNIRLAEANNINVY